MNKLNLPPYNIALEQQGNLLYVWDDLRRKWVRLTPEEWVRQHFVHYLIEHLGYPPSLLANEVALRLSKVLKRVDTILYDRLLQPQMLIEYKAPNVTLSAKTLEQAVRYNYNLRAPYLILSNGLQHLVYQIDYKLQSYKRLDNIPHYHNL